MIWDAPCFILSNYADPKSKLIALGVIDISTRSGNPENEEFLDFGKVKVKKY